MVISVFDPVLLRSFVAVVDCGNFTRAAERLHLTQSTVSQQIRRLEDAVACQLLDRDQRRVVATAEGERLLAYARRILALHDKNPQELYERLNRITGQRQDPCVLYTFRCAVYYATEPNPDPEKLKWWNWKNG